MEKMTQIGVSNQVTAGEFAARIQASISKSGQTGRPFLVLLIQIANMRAFRNQRPTLVVNALLREILTAVRKALHPSQYVGVFQDGLGFVFEGMDVGQADV